jgi:AcrR family transcriptional regulator
MNATPTRDRIRDSAADLFQLQGYHATGVKQIVRGAGAPLASLYHFFPGGKEALGAEVVRVSGAGYQTLVESVWDAAPDIVAGVHAVFDGAAAVLEATDYEDACPIATVALEVASTNETLRLATAEVFDAWIASATGRLVTAGLPEREARTLAFAIVGGLEGAFVLARATRSVAPLAAAGRVAADAVERALELAG